MAVEGTTDSGTDLSPSVDTALRWARAATPVDEAVGSIAILFGIINTHRGTSEPDALLAHVGRSREELVDAMRAAAPGLELGVTGPAEEPATFDADGDQVMRAAADLVSQYDAFGDQRMHMPHLSGAILMGGNHVRAEAVLRDVVGEAVAIAGRDYRLFLEELGTNRSATYGDFLDRHPAVVPDPVPPVVEPFVGRKRELDQIRNAIRSGAVVVLVGPRGSGKTALAIRAAAQFDAPLTYVDGKGPGAAAAVQRALAETSATLLVLDDADRSEIAALVPQILGPAIVTMLEEPTAGRTVWLDVLVPADMARVLLARAPAGYSDDELAPLMRITDGFPGTADQIGELLGAGLGVEDLVGEAMSLLADLQRIDPDTGWKKLEVLYRACAPHEQAVFRAAGFLEGTFSAAQAARASETRETIATRALARLADDGLLEAGDDGWSLRDTARSFARRMFADRPPPEHNRGVLNAIAARHGLVAHVEEPPALAGLRSDQPSRIDHIGFTPDVEALCSVLIAEKVTPPISVGLFGEWGTGKSTFMRLMRDRIRGLQAEWTDRPDSPFCKSVKQITFNAWNYSDANLWASLVTRIFEGLAGPDPEIEKDPELQPSHRAAIVKALKTAELTIAEKEAERAEAKRREAKLVSRSKALAKKETAAGERLAEISPAELMAKARTSKKVKALGSEVLRTAGADSNADAVVVARELQTTVGFAARAAGMLGRGKAILLGGVTLVALAGAGAAEAYGIPVFGTVASIAAWLGTVAAVAREPVERTRRAAAAADELLEGLREEEQAAVRREEAAVHQELAQLAAQRARLDAELDEARAAAARAQREITDIESGRRLTQFVEDRAASAEYRQYLGLIALIRRDFDELTSLLLGSEADKPPFDRIILYIDDLDRCRAELVVQVLEAVHLLLALELFVVIVGVDPRWLHESLKHHYIGQLGLEDGTAVPSTAVEDWATTPQNYLEKIFQIPFALRPMDKTGFSDMMGNLFEVRPVATQAGQRDVPRVEQREVPHSGDGAAGNGAPPTTTTGEPTPAARERTREMLRIWPAELEFIQRLGDLSPTPRAANRLANTYRLIRVSQDAAGVKGFVVREGKGGEYKVAVVLLAIVVGFSDIANDVLDKLCDGEHGTFWEFVSALTPEPEMNPRTAAEYDRLREGLEGMKEKPGLPSDIALYRKWVERVARYSFDTARRP